jgi:pimeloyl-ACP methyl ester carboxylesterase
MARRRRSGGKLLTALLPVLLVVAAAVIGLSFLIVSNATRPPRQPYLVTPEKFAQLSDRGLRATEETWTNHDQTQARGWLLRGEAGAPAVILLHRFGADRSWLLNLGVKVNEATNMTVLLPDLRGHGEGPLVDRTGLGVEDSADTISAVAFLRTLKSSQGSALVGEKVGIYGLGLGAYAALSAAAREQSVLALALDSVPETPDEVLYEAVEKSAGFDNALFRLLARAGVRVYYGGGYENREACELAAGVREARVLLLTGEDAGPLKASTEKLGRCFHMTTRVTALTNLKLSGLSAASASPEEGETYDRRVIEFLDEALRSGA